MDKLRKQRQKSFAKPDSKVQLLVAKTVKMDISKINLHSVQNGKNCKLIIAKAIF